MTTRRIIIDTDPGIDDALAIFYALEAPELEVVGLTTVFGNAHVDTCTRNALALLEIAGRPDVPVARGAGRPLAQEFRGPASSVHGEDGLGNIGLPAPAAAPVAMDAVRFIVETVMGHPGEITLVPVGPLTNIAEAMLAEPRLAENLAGIVLMGGNAFCRGNMTAAAEANVVNDPEAADIVFGARCPITMVGLDVTEKVVMTSDRLALLSTADNPRAQALALIVPFYERFHREHSGIEGIVVHDSTAISWLRTPGLFETVSHPVRVDTGHGVGRGKTWPGTHPSDLEAEWAGRTPVTILVGADAESLVRNELALLGVSVT